MWVLESKIVPLTPLAIRQVEPVFKRQVKVPVPVAPTVTWKG